MNNDINNNKSTLNYEQILLKDPLFTEYTLNDTDSIDLLNLLFYDKRSPTFNKLKVIDSFCTICKKATTFNIKDSSQAELHEINSLMQSAGLSSQGLEESPREITLIEDLNKTDTFIRVFNCPRNPSDYKHNQIFIFKVIGSKLIKIGQYPNLVELSNNEIIKYRKLDEDIYKSLNRAIGLSAHSVGIGSFVYLRRIIEKHILYPKIEELIAEGKTTSEEISKCDFKEKIKLLKDRLPEFLVDNNNIYSVLSKGIHELVEEECNTYFPILRTAIEIVLDEEIEKKEKIKKNKTISAQLNKLT